MVESPGNVPRNKTNHYNFNKGLESMDQSELGIGWVCKVKEKKRGVPDERQ